MKKNGAKLQLWLYFLLSVLLLFRIIYLANDFIVFYRLEHQYWASLGLCILGLVLGYGVTTVFHELGHLIALKLKKAIILEFCVLGLRFIKTKTKTQIKFTLKNHYAGYVSFVDKKPEHAGIALYVSIFGAWILTVIAAVMFGLLFRFIDNYYCFCLFGGALVCTMYMMLLNFLSFIPSTDGEVLFSIKKNGEKILSLKETESLLYQGSCLSEMPNRLFAKDEYFKNGYYSYLRQLESGDIGNAKRLLDKWTNDYDSSFDNQPIALDLERFFIALAENDDKIIESLRERTVSFCDREITPTTLRIMIAYRRYTKEAEWEQALRDAFDEQQIYILEGLYRTEKSILNNFCAPS